MIETEGMGVSMMDVVCIIVTGVADLFNVEVMQFLYLLADSKKERRKGRDGEKIKENTWNVCIETCAVVITISGSIFLSG